MEHKGKETLQWENANLKLEEAFKKGEYEELLEYAKENKRILMTEVIKHGLSDVVKSSLRYGGDKMRRFEDTIVEDDEQYTLFSLGKLQGYIDCLKLLEQEHKDNLFAKAKLASAKSYKKGYSHLLEDVIKHLYSTRKAMTAKEIADVFGSKESKIQTALNILCIEGALLYDNSFRYSLSSLGKRMGRLLSLK